MSLRLIRAYVPSFDPEVELQLRGIADVEFVTTDVRQSETVVEIVVPSGSAEQVVSVLDTRYGVQEGFRVLLSELQATVPTTKVHKANENGESAADTPPLNVEELIQDVLEHAQLDWVFCVSIGIAALVASIGILRDSSALIVGSMILAPLLGPNIAIATATALADADLARRAMKVTFAGMAISLGVGAMMGFLYGVPLEATQVSGRLTVNELDFLVAATAGTAAALSYTTGALDQIVGVMIAIALLPPMVLTGMLIGDLQFAESVAPAIVTMINLIAINFAGVAVLYARRVRPRAHHEQDKARRAVYISFSVWGLMALVMAALAALVYTPA